MVLLLAVQTVYVWSFHYQNDTATLIISTLINPKTFTYPYRIGSEYLGGEKLTLINKLIRYHLRVHSRPWWSIVLFRVNYNLLLMYKFRVISVNTLLLTKINDKKTEVASYSHDHLGGAG
ncbi:MAG: hypothetical protein RLZZ176_730 [Cyanobacteriota bacterium]